MTNIEAPSDVFALHSVVESKTRLLNDAGECEEAEKESIRIRVARIKIKREQKARERRSKQRDEQRQHWVRFSLDLQ